MLDPLNLPAVVESSRGGLRIRRATRDDLSAIVRLLADDPVSAGRGDTASAADELAYAAGLERVLADAGNDLLVVVDGNTDVVGTLQLTLIPGMARRGSTRLLVEAVRVAATERSAGIGTALMRWVTDRAALELGATLVQLTSDAARVDAHRFYSRLGFVDSHVGFKYAVAQADADAARGGSDAARGDADAARTDSDSARGDADAARSGADAGQGCRMSAEDGDANGRRRPRRADVTDVELVGGAEAIEVALSDFDEGWAGRFREHRERILNALGGVPVEIEHIGSTSVPGLAAKPIIDIVVAVEDITAEEDYLDALLAAGYELRVREPGHRLVRTPARDVHVHVYERNHPAIGEYLLLRDHLRTDAADRALYESTKRALLSRRWDDMNAYADAKTGVIDEIKARARATRPRS